MRSKAGKGDAFGGWNHRGVNHGTSVEGARLGSGAPLRGWLTKPIAARRGEFSEKPGIQVIRLATWPLPRNAFIIQNLCPPWVMYNGPDMGLSRRSFLCSGVAAASIIARGATSGQRVSGLLLVANKGDRALGLIDVSSGKQVAAVAEGGVTGHEVIASPDGKIAYVPIYGDSGVGKPGTSGRTMAVIDIHERKVVKTVDFGNEVRPHCPIINPKDGRLYVTTELEKSITLIDPKTLAIVRSVPTGQPESHMLAITRDGRRGYTANVGPGTVSVLDLEKRRTLTVIPISPQTQRIALSVDDKQVFTSDQTQPRLAVIDTATNKSSHLG